MTTHHVTLDVTTDYGTQTSGVFRTEGPGFHNPEFRHRVSYYPSDDTMRLTAVAGVIAARPVKRDPDLGTVRIGDLIEVEGMGTYEVTRKAVSDPILIKVES